MATEYAPRPYAQLAWNHIASVPRANLWAGMGLGKTSIVLTWLDRYHNLLGEDRPTLVLAPLRVARSTWPDEQKKWSHLSGLEVVSATGTAAERARALKRDAQVVCTNYDNLVWLREHYAGKAWPFGTVVCDESTRLKSFRMGGPNGKRARALGAIAHTDVERWINLTGTPAPNGLRDLWGQCWFLDAGQRLGRTFGAFEERYFSWTRVKDATSHKVGLKQTVMPYAAELIHEKLADISLTIDAKDYFDIADPIVNVIEVDLPPSARAIYTELERELFAQLPDDEEIEVFNAAALTIKCLQLCNGAVYLEDGKTWKDVHDAKIDALESVIEEAGGEPVLVAYHFKSDRARLLRAFPQARTLDADPDTLRSWNAGGIPILLAHPASAGHGLNLQDGGRTIVFFGQWYDLEQHDQIIERLGPVRQLQAGHERAVFVHYIVARKTVDVTVMAARAGKTTVQQALLDYMKGKT
jgi:SNF2 family DNA or RNA helicase